ncbi:DNA primase [Planctellipticum variicoloris]|uniref:DNA primase n=1 Tax=Planctellipticum variicoloris TaxID=3064265 RepID=UPI0030136F0B|nr:DNA primase [Planctomycetaceae bacterium SH412]
MTPVSPEEFKELVRSRTDIVQLVGESVTVHSERGGRMFKSLCPFHDDHNPSMQINPVRQSYRCWVCNEGGDVFSFVMKHENVGFKEALELLAQRAGLEMPSQFRDARPPGSPERPQLLDVVAWAEQEFHQFLLNAQAAQRARNYLESRGFTSETIARYRLGYHPDDWEWLLKRASGRFSTEVLLAAKLVSERKSGSGYTDFFGLLDRVLFPIRDERGRPVSFGGRILPDAKDSSAAKYINGLESSVFAKSKLAYGLDHAREAIKQTGMVCVVEGYTDCIKCHQAGVLNVVGTLGTALTEQHVTMLKRFARTVVLVFDGDEAGVRAAERAIPRFLAQDVDLRILTLPEELDPDEYLSAYGTAAFQELIRTAPEAWEYQQRVFVERFGTESSDGRLRVLEGLLELLVLAPGVAGTVKENALLSRLPVRLGIAEGEIRKRLGELRRVRDGRSETSRVRKVAVDGPGDGEAQVALREEIVSLQRSQRKDDLLECELLQVLFTCPPMIAEVVSEIGADDFRREPCRELFCVCCDLWEHGLPPSFEKVLSQLESPQLKSFAVWIDEQARLQNVESKLAPDAAGSEGAGAPPNLLQRVLDGFRWRRKRESHQASQGRLLEHSEGASGLNTQTREALQRAMQFHQQRAAKTS